MQPRRQPHQPRPIAIALARPASVGQRLAAAYASDDGFVSGLLLALGLLAALLQYLVVSGA
jgi:hypothetical protein